MARLAYTRPNKLSLLHDELLAAGITPERVEGHGDHIWITVADDVSEAAVEAVVEAHDPTQEKPAEALRRRIIETARSAEGVLLSDLTAGQRNALMAVLLWRAGGVGPDMRVRVLRDWAG